MIEQLSIHLTRTTTRNAKAMVQMRLRNRRTVTIIGMVREPAARWAMQKLAATLGMHEEEMPVDKEYDDDLEDLERM